MGFLRALLLVALVQRSWLQRFRKQFALAVGILILVLVLRQEQALPVGLVEMRTWPLLQVP